MSKKIVLLHEPKTGQSDQTETYTDWSKCIICQENKDDQETRCPLATKRPCTQVSSYKTFALNLLEFQALDDIPFKVNPSRLDEGQGIEKTLESHRAVWHKSCYNRFDSMHLTRAKKRKSNETLSCSPVKTRNITGKTTVSSTDHCFFCGEEGGNRVYMKHLLR